MADMLSPREDAWRSLFHSFEEPRPAAPHLRAGAQDTTARAAPIQQRRPFAFFQLDDQRAAADLAGEFDRLAGRDPGQHHPAAPSAEQLAAVMSRFHAVAADNPELAQWALRMFIARWPNADVLPMPTLRQQLAVLQTEQPDRFRALTAAAPRPPSGVVVGEDALHYYRQDLDLSDHHLHWHALYSSQAATAGLQGRLFLYMHQQMLARYNTERFAAGLPPTEPFLAWDDPASWESAFQRTDLPKDPLAPWVHMAFLSNGDQYVDFDERGRSPEANAGVARVQRVTDGLRRVRDGIKNGAYASYDAVGADLEASNPAMNGGPHNRGHMVFAAVPGPDTSKAFVMANPEVAMTTPVFYRWHRAIDDFGWAWQDAQGTETARYVVPLVRMRRGDAGAATRSPDVILTPRVAVAGIDSPGFDLGAWGEQRFGGTAFETPADPADDLDELVTVLRQDPAVPNLPFLSIGTDWVYFLRLRNDGASDTVVTVRIWLAALSLASDRRNWIEMDKFVVAVPKGARKVAARGSWQSTVVRRKSVTDPMTLAETKDEFVGLDGQDGESMWCECGLPYRLLLPRGTASGMASRFLVLLTDAAQDDTASQLAEAECGSVIYCGRKNQTWPDAREMGFPFHRPFAPGADPVFAHFDGMPNAVWRDISIRAT